MKNLEDVLNQILGKLTKVDDRLLTTEERLFTIEMKLSLIKISSEKQQDRSAEKEIYLSIEEILKKYKLRHPAMNNRRRLFARVKGRPVRTRQSGKYKLINESDFKESLDMEYNYKPNSMLK
jgi:hypothetical protein